MNLNSLASELIEITPKLLVAIRKKVKEYASTDLTVPQLRILSHLKEEALGNSELADRCGVDITSMSRMADNLVKRRFITRKINRQDKRSVRLQLSKKGRQEQDRVSVAIKSWMAKEMEKLTEPEQTQLAEGLKILRILTRPKDLTTLE
jgi:DNA-binding MarR family transcriptional regulator